MWYIDDNKMKELWRVAIRAQHRHLFDLALFTCPNDEHLENEVRAIIENEAYQMQAPDNILVPDDTIDIGQLQRDDYEPEDISIIGSSIRARARARSNNDFINDDDDSTSGLKSSMTPVEDDYMDTSSESENNN